MENTTAGPPEPNADWVDSWQRSTTLDALRALLATGARATPSIARRADLSHHEIAVLEHVMEPHLLLAEAAGGSAVRLRVERLARERGWTIADTPADADVLVVCGAPGELEEHVRRLWDQLPGPRTEVRVLGADDVQAVLHDCLRHRLSLSYEAGADGMTADTVLDEVLRQVAVAI